MGRKTKGSNLLPNGRNRNNRHLRLDHSLLSSNAYRALSPSARSLLFELGALENGLNNGSLYLSVRDAAHRMGLADTTSASNAFDELIDLGFIVITKDAHFHVKAAEQSRARCFRLTWLSGPGRKGPTLDYIDREPPAGTLAFKRMQRGCAAWKRYRRALTSNRMPVLETNTLDAFADVMEQNAVSKSPTLRKQNGGFLPILIVQYSLAYTSAMPWCAVNDNETA